MARQTNHRIQNQRWRGNKIRISHLEMELDSNQASWVSCENLTKKVSLKSYLIFDIQIKESGRNLS